MHAFEYALAGQLPGAAKDLLGQLQPQLDGVVFDRLHQLDTQRLDAVHGLAERACRKGDLGGALLVAGAASFGIAFGAGKLSDLLGFELGLGKHARGRVAWLGLRGLELLEGVADSGVRQPLCPSGGCALRHPQTTLSTSARRALRPPSGDVSSI